MNWKNRSLFFFILTISLGARIYKLDRFGTWHDEIASVSAAVGVPYAGISLQYSSYQDLGFRTNKVFTSNDFWNLNTPLHVVKAAIQDNGSIAYFLTLHYWISLFGPSDFSIRFLSVLFGLLSVCAIFWLTFLISRSTQIAFIAMILASVYPMMINASQFGRSHIMAAFFTVLSTGFFYQILTPIAFKNNYNKYGVIVLYSTFGALAILSHYFTIYIFIGHFLIMIALCRQIPVWKSYISGSILMFSILFFWLLVGGFESLKYANKFNLQLQNAALHWKEGDNPYAIPASIKNISAGCVQYLLVLFGNNMQSLGFKLSKLFLLLIFPLSILFYYLKNEKTYSNPKAILFIVLTGSSLLYSTAMSVINGHTVCFIPNYSIYAAPYAIILLALSINYIIFEKKLNSNKYISICLSCLLIIMTYSTLSSYNNRGSKSLKNFPEISSELIVSRYKKGDTIIFNDWQYAQIVNLYLKDHPDILQKVDTTKIFSDNTKFEIVKHAD